MKPFRACAAALVIAAFTTAATAEEYNFNDNQNVNEKDCWAIETRIDKYLALADAALKSSDSPADQNFQTGQAYLAVAADFTHVFAKFCEDG